MPYQLKQKYKKEDNRIEIINGLLLPTERKYHINVHIDRTDLDDVKIIEHFINLKEVIINYRKNRLDFLFILSETKKIQSENSLNLFYNKYIINIVKFFYYHYFIISIFVA